MWYSFYVNEKDVIDNWDSYNEANWLLRYLLTKDDRKTPEERMNFYMDNRNEINDEWLCDYISEDTINRYLDRLYMYEEYLEEGDACGHGYVPKPQSKLIEKYFNLQHYKARLRDDFSQTNGSLRQIDEVIIYKSDLDAIEQAKKEHRLTELQVQLLFGLIFFARMYDVRWCRLNNKLRKRQFKGCFAKTIRDEDYKAVLDTKLFYVYTNAMKWKSMSKRDRTTKGMDKPEFDYCYANFDIKDEVAYVFKTNRDNNKLNLTQVAKEAMPDIKGKYCSECGKPFSPKSNRQKMCEECKIEVTREQARLRKQKQRERQKGK